MEIDIYSILEEKLRKAGVIIPEDFRVKRNGALSLAAGYTTSDRNKRSTNSIAYTEIAAINLNVSLEEMETLLIFVMEESEPVSIPTLAQKYGNSTDYFESCCSELLNNGFLEVTSETPIPQSAFRMTKKGLMCLLFCRPMDELLSEHFVVNQIVEATASVSIDTEPCDIPRETDYDEIDDILEGFFGTKKKNRQNVKTTVSTDMPFLDFLHEKVKDIFSDGLSIDRFVTLVESCLKYQRNKGFLESLTSTGFGKLTPVQKTFFLILCDYFTKNGAAPMTFDAIHSTNNRAWSIETDLMAAARDLLSTGLVVLLPEETHSGGMDETSKERFMISPEVAGTVFHGMNHLINYASICRHADIWKCDTIEPKSLLFDEIMSEQVKCLSKLMDPVLSSTLIERLKEVGRKSFTCLFYGAPGVGKTELCRQLARNTGRDCFVVDPSKVYGSYWGDSEKNIREVFRAYKYIQKISDRAPIMVFNEADGILTKRFTDVNRATEKSENTVQSIILQELETFEGIFIATTNLQNNIDPAADRRFLYKLRFDYPSVHIRKQILSMKMKWVSDEDAEALAREFCLSGGQIDNLVTRCIIEKFMTGTEATFDRMRSFCLEEVSIRGKVHRSESKIGFIHYPSKEN